VPVVPSSSLFSLSLSLSLSLLCSFCLVAFVFLFLLEIAEAAERPSLQDRLVPVYPRLALRNVKRVQVAAFTLVSPRSVVSDRRVSCSEAPESQEVSKPCGASSQTRHDAGFVPGANARISRRH
jgi:hypothetical protein